MNQGIFGFELSQTLIYFRTVINVIKGTMSIRAQKQSIVEAIQGFKSQTLTIGIWDRLTLLIHGKLGELSKRWFTHVFLLLAMILYTFVGAFLYSIIEGGPEASQVKELLTQRRDVIAKIKELVASGSPKLLEKSEALIKIYEERLIEHFGKNSKLLMRGDDDLNWNFWGSAFFCGSIYTTIGYGHIAPLTKTGRALTIIYALIGVPLFLTVLADFGKILTKWIKFLWLFVLRAYYTGSISKPRHLGPRSSSSTVIDDEDDENDFDEIQMGGGLRIMDDSGENFTLPVSLALSVFVMYLIFGAVVYYLWEEWTFFEACYFVFISMATIGFGDLVPSTQFSQNTLLVYLIFGLALTSMCINVVREKLTETFTQASVKLGHTVGLEHLEDHLVIAPSDTEEKQASPENTYETIARPSTRDDLQKAGFTIILDKSAKAAAQRRYSENLLTP